MTTFKLHGFRSKKFVWELAMLLWQEAVSQEGYSQEAMSAFTVVHKNMRPFFVSGWGKKQWEDVYKEVREDFAANVAKQAAFDGLGF